MFSKIKLTDLLETLKDFTKGALIGWKKNWIVLSDIFGKFSTYSITFSIILSDTFFL